MDDSHEHKAIEASKKPTRRRWLIALGCLLVLGFALFTEVNFNKPLEAYAKPEMSGDQVNDTLERGDFAQAFPSVVHFALDDTPDVMFIVGEYFRKGLPPVHRDYCSAFDGVQN